MATYSGTAGYDQEKFSAKSVVADLENDSTLEADRKAEANAADVQDARFIGYSDVLDVYQARTDTEHLADRRARHYASDPAEQNFARHENYDGVSGTGADSDGADTDDAGAVDQEGPETPA